MQEENQADPVTPDASAQPVPPSQTPANESAAAPNLNNPTPAPSEPVEKTPAPSAIPTPSQPQVGRAPESSPISTATPTASKSKMPLLIVGVIVVLAITGVVAWSYAKKRMNSPTVSSKQSQLTTTSNQIPKAAQTTCHLLVSGSPAQQLIVLAPAMASLIPSGTLFPPGSTIVLNATSWHQSANYANVTGTLSTPNQKDQQVEIGLVLQSGSWLVTSEEAAP